MRLQTTPIGSTASQPIYKALCETTDAVGDVIRITGDKVGDRYQVTRVDIDTLPTLPAIGIIIQKTAPTECLIQTAGVVSNIYTGLTPHLTLFVGTDGRLTHTVTPHPSTGQRAHQIMGVALGTTDLLLDVKSPIILTT